RGRRRHRRAARPVRRHLPRRIRQARQADLGDPLHQRHPAERAVDHHRPVHLRRHRGADGRLLGLRRLPGAGRDRNPCRSPHHRGHAGLGAQPAARGGVSARPAALAGDPADCLPRRAKRPDHRRAAGDRPRRRRDRAAAVHRAVEPVLQPEPDQDDGEPAGYHQQLRAEPLCLLEAARLERGAADHAHRIGPEYWRAHSRRREDIQMTELSVSVSNAGGPVPQVLLPEAEPKVTARGLNFYYGEHHALKNINLTLGTNRVTAFIGPSGCGKSTLLRIFNRMYDLYPGQKATGQLMLDQTNILDPKLDLNLLRARVGMVFQKPTPFPMTIYENIAFGIRLYEKISKSEMDGRVEKALRGGALWNEVKDKLNASGLSLSGGQQQRLCIARTVAVRPEVILFDEPCSALDPISTAKVEELIEFDDTSKIFTSPSDRRTQDYITGRFG